jgi:hypothetical protein
MFKKSKDSTQQDMFSSIPSMLNGSSYKQYSEDSAWHNMFRKQVVERVDEGIFKPLYDETMGAPNASTRVLVGMMALKEGFGWSDNELFEQCRFNLLVRSALGLFNINDSIPAESTYYLFRKRIHDYQRQNDVDIIESAFRQITREQALDYQVSGRSIRMDSKLIGSNIAWCTRYEIVHDTIALFCKAIKESTRKKLKIDLRSRITEITENESRKIVYRLIREEVKMKLNSLGYLIFDLLSLARERDNPHYQLLLRVYQEQYRVNGYVVELRAKEEIKSDSIQSPHDTDCAYRNKDGQQVKGYRANVTETCDENSLNLIVDVQVSKANTPDVEFLQPAINTTEQVLSHKPEDIHADGAYQSPENVAYCQNNKINPYFTGMQGMAGRYDLTLKADELVVIDTHTGEIIPAKKAKAIKSGKPEERWVIKTSDGKSRYFSRQEIDACQVRKQIAGMPVEKRIKRNNVEATIFQLSYFTRNNKIRYRGLYQTKMWATLRCIWINLKRIIAYVEPIYQRTLKIREIMQKDIASYKKAINFYISGQIFNLYYSFVKYFSIYHIKINFGKTYLL